jgi:D-alanyl-D-alanine carboxypeptidase/D-alanyl-D-alanine-endopeptidase (penicillin-binding protein 4)
MRIQVARPRPPQPPPAPPSPPPTPPIRAEADYAPQPERRATPERIAPIEDHVDAVEDHPDEPEKRRRKPVLLISSIVLVLLLAGGSVFASIRLGWFEDTPIATTQPPAPPAQVALSLRAVGKEGPAPSAAGVKGALAGPAANPVLGTLTGTVIDPVTGTPLWQQADTTPLTPASTIKLLAAAAALLTIDHTAQLSTKVVQGDQPGTVVLVGGGDPTLSSLPAGKNTVYPGAGTVDDLAAQVKAAAGGPVTQVQLDLSRYTGPDMAPEWDRADIAGGDVAPIVPVMMDGGRQDPQTVVVPRTSTPATDTAAALATRLGATVGAQTTAPASGKVLGEVKSVPIDQLVENMMQISDNILAEAVAREVAKVKGAETSFGGAAKAVRDVLTTNGFDLTGANIVDASGLSSADKLPARLLGEILAVAAKPDASDPRTAKLRPLLTALPVAGGSGTLAPRFQDASSVAGKGWVRAKTGTLTGVNSLAGVVVDKDGKLLVFALMSNSGSNALDVRPALDVLATTLRGCGCS